MLFTVSAACVGRLSQFCKGASNILGGPQQLRRRRSARPVNVAAADAALEARCLLAASFGFDFTTVASDLHPTERFFGDTDPANAPFTILRYGFGQVTSLEGLPRTEDSVWLTSHLTFSFGSNDEENPVEALTLSSFDDGLGDGTAREVFTADGIDDVPTLTIFNEGTPIATGVLLNVSLAIMPSGSTTSNADDPSRFQITGPLGDDPTIYNELMAATNNTGIVEFTLSEFNYEGDWLGIGDAQIFSSTGVSINLTDPAPPVDDHGNDPATATSWNRIGTINGEFEASLNDNGDGTFSDDEVDYFEVELVSGRQYTFQALALDQTENESVGIHVSDVTDVTIASGDPLPGTNNWTTWVTVSASYTGTYFLQVLNQGAGVGSYSVTQIDDIAVGSDDHGNGTTPSDATPWDRASGITGNIEVPEDQDWFSVSLTAGTEYVFQTSPGTLLDTVMSIHDADRILLDTNDDADGAAFDEYHSKLTFLAPATGTYFVAVSGYGDATIGSEEPFRVGTYGLIQVGEFVMTPRRPVINSTSNPMTTTEQRPTITWDPVEYAFEYDVYINNVTTPGTPIVRVRTTETSFTPEIDLGIGRLQVWVQAIYTRNARSPWSHPLNLRVITPVTIGPVDFHSTSARPTFSWQTLEGADSYYLWVNNRTTGETQVISTSVDGNEFTPLSDLDAGVYRYWVRGVSSDGLVAQWSSFAEIYVGPQHVAPVLPTFENSPLFEWTAVNDAVSYDVWLQRNSNVLETPTEIVGTTWTPAAPLTNGNHHWWVRPRLTGGQIGPWSLRQTFNVGGTPIIDTPISPGPTTTVSWTPVGGAVSYNLFVRRDFNGQAFVQQSNQVENSVELDTSLPGTYRVWIQAVGAGANVSGWSLPVDFAYALASSDHSPLLGVQIQSDVLPAMLLTTLENELPASPPESSEVPVVIPEPRLLDPASSQPSQTMHTASQNNAAGTVEVARTSGSPEVLRSSAVRQFVTLPEDRVMSDVHQMIAMLDQ